MLGGGMGRSILSIQFSTASGHGSAAVINTLTEKPVFKGSGVLVLVRIAFSPLPGKHKGKVFLVLLSLSRYQKAGISTDASALAVRWMSGFRLLS